MTSTEAFHGFVIPYILIIVCGFLFPEIPQGQLGDRAYATPRGLNGSTKLLYRGEPQRA